VFEMDSASGTPSYGRRWFPQRFAKYCLEGGFMLTFIAFVSIQLFIPPYIGMADNGDFAKVARRLSLVPANTGYGYEYFTADYIFLRTSHWESDFRTSEQWPATIAFLLSGVKTEGDVFNIRWLGAIHALILILVFGLVLLITRVTGVWVSVGVRFAVLWIFSDVLYVSYLNSFYSDTTAVLGLLGSVTLAALIIVRGPQTVWVLGFMLFAVLLITSKAQHALWGVLPALFLFFTVRRNGRVATRVLRAGGAVVLLAAMVVVLWITPTHYKGEARFNLIFRKILKSSLMPAQDLLELGLPATDVRFIGFTAYAPDSPAADEKWFAEFCHRTSYKKVAAFYAHHPIRAFDIMKRDLETWARYIRFDFGNFRRQDAVRPGQRAETFALWSDFRIWLFFLWPAHIVAWYSILTVGAIVVLATRPSMIAVQFAWLTIALIGAAGTEYIISSLADSEETFRHLFLFHAITDVTVCTALVGLLTGTVKQSIEILSKRVLRHSSVSLNVFV